MGLALAIIQLLNAAAPGIADLVLLIRKKDGSVSVMPLLDEADAQFSNNMQQASDWLKSHPK